MVKIFPSLLSSLPAFLSLSTHIWYDVPPSIFQSKLFTSQVLYFGLLALGDERGQFSSAQSLSHVQLFVNPWIGAHQASLSITNSQRLLKIMSIELVMPSNHLILCHPLLLLHSILPSIRSFPMSQLFATGGQSIGVSASASVLPMNTRD